MMAEQESMTPMLAGGLQGADVADSATGSLMIREASTTVLDFLSEDWDDNVTEKVIRRMYGWNMQYNPNPNIKGNYTIDVRTSTEYKNKQMHIRDMERLRMEAQSNPAIAQVVNMDELVKASLAMMHLPSAAILKTPEEIAAAAQAAAEQPNPDMLKMQVEMEKVNVDKQRLALEAQKLQFEQTLQQQREIMDYQERQQANQARVLEAQATVLKVQTEKEIKFLELAQRMEEGKERNKIMAQIAILNDSTKRFQAQAQSEAKARDQLLTIEEMKIKNREGTGI
jgi:hypothetical protein